MSQLRHVATDLKQLNVEVMVITFDIDFLAKAYIRDTGLTWPLVADRSRELYTAFGMQRASLWSLYNPISLAKYLWLIIKGRRPGTPGEDWSQLGGDVLINPKGRIHFLFRSRSPHDRPSPEAILKIIREESQPNRASSVDKANFNST